jgi:hypothetical protein
MKVYLEAVPFNSSKLAAWVECHLVSDHLGELIEELLAVRPPPKALDFDKWFALYQDQILSGGLAGLPRAALRQLLAYPPALRKLQKAVLLGGGQYWDRVPRSKGFRRRLASARPDLPAPPPPVTRTPLPQAPRPLPPEPVPLVPAPPEEAAESPRARGAVPTWLVVVAVAATAAVSGLLVWVVLSLT